MPQATDECRAAWEHGVEYEMDSHTITAETRAFDHLIAAGFSFDQKRWRFAPPAGYEPTARDLSAIEYLVTEWDYGGLEPAPQSL